MHSYGVLGLAPFTLACVLVPAVPIAISASSDAPGNGPCKCKDIVALEEDLENAKLLAQVFDQEATTLNDLIKNGKIENTDDAYDSWYKKDLRPWVKQGCIKLPTGVTGPNAVEYKHDENSCTRTKKSEDDLKEAEDRSVCKGMADAIKEHEDHHQGECEKMGVEKYDRRSGVQSATEEAHAYSKQVDELQKAIDEARADCSCLELGAIGKPGCRAHDTGGGHRCRLPPFSTGLPTAH